MHTTRFAGRVTGALAVFCTCAMLAGATTAASATPTSNVTEAQQDSMHGHARGTPVSVVPVDRMDAAAVTEYLRKSRVDASRVRSGVRAYRVVYHAVRPDGSPTTASELVAVPKRRSGFLHQAMWLHGTTLYRRGVASMTGDRFDRHAVFAIAAAGYAVTAPDYLGLGDSTDYHPYIHLPSTVSASVDALRASRAVLAARRFWLDREVLVTGHSQGGSATMAVGRALPGAGLRAGVLAPLSGPFDVGRLIDEALANRIPNSTAYTAYLAIAWNRLYHLYPSHGAMFRAPYNRVVPPLFNGEHPAEEVLPQLPKTPAELFTDEALDRMREPSGVLRSAVAQASSACDWRPGVVVTLYTARGDRDVPSWNARYCQRAVRANGGHARVVDLGDVDHRTMAIRALPMVLAEFDAHHAHTPPMISAPDAATQNAATIGRRRAPIQQIPGGTIGSIGHRVAS